MYNASVYYWKVARPLMRRGTFRFGVESLTRVVLSLEDVADKDVGWRIRCVPIWWNLMCVCVCLFMRCYEHIVVDRF